MKRSSNRILSAFLAVALLAGCMSILASAEGIFKQDDLTLHRGQNSNFFRDAAKKCGEALRFTSS